MSMCNGLLVYLPVAEVEQFDFETKIRGIIGETITPVAERSHQNHNELKGVKHRLDYVTRKVDEIDKILKTDLNLKPTLADTKRRLHAIDMEHSQQY